MRLKQKSHLDFTNRILLYLESKRLIQILLCAPNGERYPLVGGTRGRHFAGTSLKPRQLPENAATPTSRVHALLGGGLTSYHFPK